MLNKLGAQRLLSILRHVCKRNDRFVGTDAVSENGTRKLMVLGSPKVRVFKPLTFTILTVIVVVVLAVFRSRLLSIVGGLLEKKKLKKIE